MAAELTGFRIAELHGRQNVNIVIQDDCVVLVGVNGLGKTTIINMLYYFLTRQWLRLLEYQFKSVAVDIAGQTLSITRSQIESPIHESEWRRRLAHVNPRFHILFDRDPQLLYSLVSAPHDATFLRKLAERSNISLNMLMMLRRSLEEEPLQQTLFESLSEVKELEDHLARLLQSQVLYLPTYRRIERDLEKIFPGLEEEIQKYRSLRSAHDDVYIEFVEFGMRDVERRFDELFTQLKERARFELNSLAATYLGEVIRGEADTYDTSLISSLDESTIAKILNRVEERQILDEPDKETLRHVIT
jgi:hypothetical protein